MAGDVVDAVDIVFRQEEMRAVDVVREGRGSWYLKLPRPKTVGQTAANGCEMRCRPFEASCQTCGVRWQLPSGRRTGAVGEGAHRGVFSS